MDDNNFWRRAEMDGNKSERRMKEPVESRKTKGLTGDHDDEEGGWSTVRRRSKQPQNGNTNGGTVTSFYVSNLPEGITKQKIKYVFTQFGRVVDIYIGGKRDRVGLIFAFVKFSNVEDPKAMEQAMLKVRCEHSILKVNIARYQKQSNAPNQTVISKQTVIPKTYPPKLIHTDNRAREKPWNSNQPP
ncbi:hypothetical protein LXL04_014299 [Taraxacum kok-saghyz]